MNIQVVEDNFRYTKLAFPIKEDQTWDGNAFNTLPMQDYKYAYFDKPETLNNLSFAKVVKVDQKNEASLIEKKAQFEKYAKGVGLIEKEIIEIYSNNVIQGIPIEQRIEKGYIYKQRIIAYGKE
ncbi:MAG: hypothetical protein AB7O73_14715 [Bacteroidia bacterium]